MHLYLLRHGQAEPYRTADAERALTPQGREEVRRVARLFADRHIPLDACFYSPYVRTTQTCETFMAEAKPGIRPEPLGVLMPNHRAADVLAFLKSLEREHVLLVTHNPLVSELLAVLTGTDTDRMHVFATGELNAVDCVACVPGGGTAGFRLEP